MVSDNLDNEDIFVRQTLLKQVGKKGQQALLEASVLIVGMGGLGCPVAQYLSSMGVGRLGIVDGDVVESSNLHRQILFGVSDIGEKKVEAASRRLKELNPRIQINRYAQNLSADNALHLVKGFDLVVDGSDNFDCRYLLNDACVALGIPFVSGAINQFEAQISLFNAPQGPCYRCLYPVSPMLGQVQNCEEAGVLGVMPGIVGTIMAMEVAKYLLGVSGTLVGRVLHIDALGASFRLFQLGRLKDCAGCGANQKPDELSLSRKAAHEDSYGCRGRYHRVQLQHSSGRFFLL